MYRLGVCVDCLCFQESGYYLFELGANKEAALAWAHAGQTGEKLIRQFMENELPKAPAVDLLA
jgi:hypothetical protein